MGHQIYYDSFSVKTSKEKIFAEVNERAIHEGDYHCGVDPIEWRNECFNSKEEAEVFIDKHDHPYASIAVRYKYQENFKPSKTLQSMNDKAVQAAKTYFELRDRKHFKDHKSAFIGCKHCGSKLATEYIRSRNSCPVCNQDLRPKTVLDRLASLKTKMEELKKAADTKEREERLKNISKAQEFWLVKTEFHV